MRFLYAKPDGGAETDFYLESNYTKDKDVLQGRKMALFGRRAGYEKSQTQIRSGSLGERESTFQGHNLGRASDRREGGFHGLPFYIVNSRLTRARMGARAHWLRVFGDRKGGFQVKRP